MFEGPKHEEKKRESDKSSRRNFLKKAAGAGIVAAGMGVLARVFYEEKSSHPEGKEETKRRAGENRGKSKDEHMREDGAGRVAAEVRFAGELLRSGDVEQFLKSPYLISALYYSDAFLSETVGSKNGNEPIDIIRGIRALVSDEARGRYLTSFNVLARRKMRGANISSFPVMSPVDRLDFGNGNGHGDAVDAFAREGAPVYALQGGVVILAESGWSEGDLFSTSSPKCGNTVLIYSPENNEFFRYCHLDMVQASPGTALSSGTPIGSVGRSGKNATRQGSASHVHIESNWYDPVRKKVNARTSQFLKQLVQGAVRP